MFANETKKKKKTVPADSMIPGGPAGRPARAQAARPYQLIPVPPSAMHAGKIHFQT
jgi:hypothetical protein